MRELQCIFLFFSREKRREEKMLYPVIAFSGILAYSVHLSSPGIVIAERQVTHSESDGVSKEVGREQDNVARQRNGALS